MQQVITDSPAVPDVLMARDWFADLSVAARMELCVRARRLQLDRGSRVYARGERPDGLYVVLTGLIRSCGVDPSGRETILDFYGPGSVVGEVALFADARRSISSFACERSTVLFLSRREIEALLQAHSCFCRSMLRLEAQRLLVLLHALESYSHYSIEQRLASRLLMLAHDHGRSESTGLRIALKLSQETLARLTGSTRQRMNQILKSWQQKQIVVHRASQLEIRDPAALERLAGTR